MIHLIRIYNHDQTQPVYVDTFDHSEKRQGPPDFPGGHRKDCRCRPTWGDYYSWLAKEHDGWIEHVEIYPTPTKKRNT